MRFRLRPGDAPKRVIASYIFDYAIIIILIAASIISDRVEPFHQQFSLRNYTLQYKYAVHERVPDSLLWLVAIIIPAAIMAIHTLAIDGLFSTRVNGRKRKYTWRERAWELNAALLGLGLAISLQYVIVSTLKNAIGKPRPDLIDRCRPAPGSGDPLPFGLSTSAVCTQTDRSVLKDGFRSFPSGHSATSFGGLFYLSLFLAARLRIFDSRGHVWRVFAVLAPTLAAALVAGTRIMDARHHPPDVLAGSAVGLLVATLAYRQYFPSPRDLRSGGRAYPVRGWAGDSDGAAEREGGYEGARDDEEERAAGAGGNLFRDEVSRAQRAREVGVRGALSGGEGSPVPGIVVPGEDEGLARSREEPAGLGLYDPYGAEEGEASGRPVEGRSVV